MLLIPGWATDCGIFDPLDIRFNYLLPLDPSPAGFGEDLIKAIRGNNLKKISVLGWSMGAFMACDLLPEYGDCINEIFLVSARKRYAKIQNENIKILLMRSRKAFLRKFYHDCFSEEENDALSWFKENLLKDYLEEMELKQLLEGLDYLSGRRIDASALEGARVTFVHGREDKIAPIKEVMELKAEAPRARYIFIEGAGHMPFLTQKFKRIFDNESML